MKLFGFLLLLSALNSRGYSLICKNCWHMYATPCTQPTMACASDQICVAAYSETSLEGYVQPQYSLTCGKRSECNVTGSLTFNLGRIRTGTTCCDTDNCIPPTPILPPVDTQKNGKKCRTCITDTSDYCYTSDTIECTGEDTKCALMTRRLSGTINLKDALRGCATRSFCEIIGNQQTSVSGLNVDMKTHCSDGAGDMSAGLSLSLLAALLAKLLV